MATDELRLRDEVDVNLGEIPPISAGEILELIGFRLFDLAVEAAIISRCSGFSVAIAVATGRSSHG